MEIISVLTWVGFNWLLSTQNDTLCCCKRRNKRNSHMKIIPAHWFVETAEKCMTYAWLWRKASTGECNVPLTLLPLFLWDFSPWRVISSDSQFAVQSASLQKVQVQGVACLQVQVWEDRGIWNFIAKDDRDYFSSHQTLGNMDKKCHESMKIS